MAEQDGPANHDGLHDPEARIEAALERIAALAARRDEPQQDGGPDQAELKARLEALIARLRGALESER